MGLIVTDIPEHLVRIFNHRGAFVRTHRRNFFAHVGNTVWIGNDNFFRFFTAQIIEFRQHFLCGAQVQGRLIVCVFKALACHNNPAVYLVLRVQKMYIAGCHHRFVKFFAQRYNSAVDIS